MPPNSSEFGVVALVVVSLAAVIVFFGGAVEGRQVWRERRRTYTEEEALEGLRNVFSGSIFGWLALAAIAILLPRLWHDGSLSGWDTVVAITLLALAGERAQYVVTAWSPPNTKRPVRVAAIAVMVLAGGLAVSLSS